jgi:hypothetical protein
VILRENDSEEVIFLEQTMKISGAFGWNYKPAEKHCWMIFCERKILFRLKKQAE